jgi:beta-lactamase class C
MSGSGSERLLEIIGKWMEKYLDGDTQTGVALSMVLGGEVAQYWNGLANREKGTTVDLDTLFVIASVQKVFTSTLCAVRIVNGKMQLPDPVTKYLPPDVGKDGRAINEVTLGALTTMTAGMPRNATKEPASNLYNDLPPSPELQKWWTDFVPQWPIGTKEFYSNVGVVTLGFATAQAGGAGYTGLLANDITGPLEMPSTVVDVSGFPADRIAQGYNKAGNRVADRGVGLNSTANDLIRFVQANLFMLSAPDTLTQAMRLAQTPLFQSSDNQAIAMNWYVTRLDDGSRLIGKDGGNAGFSAWIGFIPEQQAGIALLSNGHPAGISLTKAGKQILLEATGISADDALLETSDQGALHAGIGD